MKYIFNIFKFVFLVFVVNLIGFKVFEVFTMMLFTFGFLAEFLFVSSFVLTSLMVLYGFYGFVCDLFGFKKYEVSRFFDDKEKPQYQ